MAFNWLWSQCRHDFRSTRIAMQNVNVVLAHGASADGSSWARVIMALKAESLKVSAAPLPLTSLSDDVAVLNRSLDPYAGAVIALARPERAKALVYVAALAPDEGERVADVFYRGKPHPLAPKLAPDGHGLIWLPEKCHRDGVRVKRVCRGLGSACGGAATDIAELHHCSSRTAALERHIELVLGR
jgi:hypothetical protein